MNATQLLCLFAVVLAVVVPMHHASAADSPSTAPLEANKNIPQLINTDGALKLTFGDEHVVLHRGLQPSLRCTRAGTLILQAQIPEKPFPSKRMTYPYAMQTVV